MASLQIRCHLPRHRDDLWCHTVAERQGTYLGTRQGKLILTLRHFGTNEPFCLKDLGNDPTQIHKVRIYS
jgi:hypothetical protein